MSLSEFWRYTYFGRSNTIPAAIPAYLLRSISRCNHIHSNRPSFCQVLQVLFCAGRDPRKKRLGRNAHESLVHKIGGPRLQRRCCCLSRILTAGPRPNWPASKRPRRSRCRPIITAQSLRRCPSIRAGAHRACFVSGPPVSASGQNFTCRVPRRHGQLLPERHDAFHGEFVARKRHKGSRARADKRACPDPRNDI
jgi:hypothetical protein